MALVHREALSCEKPNTTSIKFSTGLARYFGVAEVGRDQAQEYAERKGMSLEETEKWPASNLAYDPEE